MSMHKEQHHIKRRYAKSSSFIMALLFTILCGAVALCLGFFINFFAKGHFTQSTETLLDTRFAYIQHVEQFNDSEDGEFLQFRLNTENDIFKTLNIDVKRLAEGVILFNYPLNQQRYAAKIYSDDQQQKTVVAYNITEIAKDFRLMQIMGICSIGFVMIVVFVSYIISVFVVSGTNKIAVTAQEIITTGDLSRRLDFHYRWDDLSNMASVLNLLFDRIEELMNGVRRVSDNIAHDLRTPLTRMRNHIEDLQSRSSDPAYESLLDEADHLLNTFTALLRITRIETEQQRTHFDQISLDQIMSDVISFYAPLAEEKQISLTSSLIESDIKGDKDLIFQAFANILDNAIKFTPENGTITVKMDMNGPKQIRIIIEDSGHGIKKEDLEKVFDRFYRADMSRNKAGVGLGLSLVRAVISLHKGDITLENSGNGLRIITNL